MSAQQVRRSIEQAHRNLKPSPLVYGVRKAFVAAVLWRGGK